MGYALHLIFPFFPLSVAIVATMAGMGGAAMRMPFTVIILMFTLSNRELLPVATIAAFTSFLSATILAAGNARKAMTDAAEKRSEIYIPSKPDASEPASQ